jgi:hypothetical protein
LGLSGLVASSKRLRLDPFAYLGDVFAGISAHPHNRLEEPLPDRWAAARAAQSS